MIEVFAGDTGSFCPGLRITRDDRGHRHTRLDTERFDELLARCRAAA